MDNKVVLVTGGAGFIGSNLCEALVAQGYRVLSLDNYFTGRKENHVQGVEYREGHTKDIEALVPESPALVYHLGEYSRVAKSIEEPALVWDLNLRGTQAVLEFCRARGSKLIYAGSSTKMAQARVDGTLGRDLSPYTWAKAANTELVHNYGHWYALSYSIAYFYNVYGPRELSGEYGTVIEIFKQKYLAGEPLPVRAPGTQERIYTHVADTVRALLLIGETNAQEEYTIASKEKYQTRAVAELFGGPIEMLPERSTSRPAPALDTNTATLEALGWQPAHRLVDYIDEIKRTKSGA